MLHRIVRVVLTITLSLTTVVHEYLESNTSFGKVAVQIV